jgi:hypothetical protein
MARPLRAGARPVWLVRKPAPAKQPTVYLPKLRVARLVELVAGKRVTPRSHLSGRGGYRVNTWDPRKVDPSTRGMGPRRYAYWQTELPWLRNAGRNPYETYVPVRRPKGGK